MRTLISAWRDRLSGSPPLFRTLISTSRRGAVLVPWSGIASECHNTSVMTANASSHSFTTARAWSHGSNETSWKAIKASVGTFVVEWLRDCGYTNTTICFMLKCSRTSAAGMCPITINEVQYDSGRFTMYENRYFCFDTTATWLWTGRSPWIRGFSKQFAGPNMAHYL